MGVSGMKGQVYYINSSCPTTSCTGWSTAPGGGTCFQDEITRFVIEDSVTKREYGHDKSFGWQDVVAGTRRFGITMDAMWVPKGAVSGDIDELLYAGKVLFLELYPTGVGSDCDTPYKGFAMIDRVTKTHDIERGTPISYSCTLSSKGPWTGPSTGTAWGGFECDCVSAA